MVLRLARCAFLNALLETRLGLSSSPQEMTKVLILETDIFGDYEIT